MTRKGFTFSGLLYRALNPVYAREPLSGRGAELYGGRFNPKGMAALYASTSIMTAIREANQVGDLQPTLLVSYRVHIQRIFDATDPRLLESVGISAADLADSSWRDQMRGQGEARTQKFARDLYQEGYQGMLVPSYAKGAGASDLNMVLWRWGGHGCEIKVIDEQNRLRIRR